MLLMLSLFSLSGLVQNSRLFDQYHGWFLTFNVLMLIVLGSLVIVNFVRLIKDLYVHKLGAKLRLRLSFILTLSILVPAIIVYTFSNQMLEDGIDSWFNVDVENALNNSLELGNWSLNMQLQRMHQDVATMAEEISDTPAELSSFILRSLSDERGLSEITLLNTNREIIASYGGDMENVLPVLLPEDVVHRVLQGEHHVSLDLIRNNFYARLILPVEPEEILGSKRLLQVLYPMPERINRLTRNVEEAYDEYNNLIFLRDALKQSFRLTLILVLLFAILFAIWVAFFYTQRLIAPILQLARGTKDISVGKLDTRIKVPIKDELGELAMSFNSMARKLNEAKDIADTNRRQLEKQRAYLETILRHLSSGVLSLDKNLKLKTANVAASEILSISLDTLINQSVQDTTTEEWLKTFYIALRENLTGAEQQQHWEIDLCIAEKNKTLFCRGAQLPDGGYVVVVNDISDLVQAQRDRAWKDVARRMAHEFKNPLTPIRLSAERLKNKLNTHLGESDSAFLERSADTIIHQVDAMGKIVNEFRQFSRGDAPLELKEIDLHVLISELVDFYGYSGKINIKWQPFKPSVMINGDETRLRQLLHNLLTNALEALEQTPEPQVHISTTMSKPDTIQITLRDNGPGFSRNVIENAFEPYVTTKEKGQGLGLAIVKKIVEEHRGEIHITNTSDNKGSIIVITLHTTMSLNDTPTREE